MLNTMRTREGNTDPREIITSSDCKLGGVNSLVVLLLDLAALTPACCLTLSKQKNCGDDLGGFTC